MGHSKTVTETYVASYSYPLFNADDRLNSYLSAELDYTSNSEIEQSEYMKRYYTPSRFRNYRSYLRWWENHGNANVFGRIQATFYGDPTVDNLVVTNAIKPYAYMKAGAKDFLVYSTALNYFSEDAWIKHLATKQGKASWVYQELAYAYTISFPTDTRIKATFSKIPDADKETYPDSKDWVVEGSLPTYTPNSRFLECAYSYAITKTRQETTIDKDGKEIVVTVPYDERHYGYYTYQEGSGIPKLDSIIANSGTHPRGTFFPVIPIRTNTAWYTGDAAERISDSLRFLEIYSRYKDKPDPYPALINNLVSGINEGSISDIDYMTLVHGVTLNSRNQADLKYMYNFFLNLHVNEALSRGEDPLEVWNPRPTYVGSNYFGAFIEKCVHKWNTHEGGRSIWKRIRNIDNSFHHHLNITCASSNLNYDYSWAQSQYFEANGKFRPDAKVGQYGVLTGTYKYTWTEMVQVYDDEGNPKYHWSGDDESGEMVPTLEPKEFSIPFTFTLFCYQISADRWHFIDFVCLELTNHIYAGKTIITTAYEAVTDNSQTSSVTHDFTNDFAYDQLYYDEIEKKKKYRENQSWKSIFSFIKEYLVSPEEEVAEDFRKNNPTKWLNLTFQYGTGLPDSTSPFIVPFELNTFNEMGARTQMDIINGGLFLICNCWEQVTYKKKWYQRGFFKYFGGFVLQMVGFAVHFVLPGIGALIYTVGGLYNLMVVTGIALKILQKTLTLIFGKRIGMFIYNAFKTVVLIIAAVLCQCWRIPVFGWILYAIGAAVTFAVVAGDAWANGEDPWKAMLRGVTAATATATAGLISGYFTPAGTLAAPASGATGAGATVGSVAAETATTSFGSQLWNAGYTAVSNTFTGAATQGGITLAQAGGRIAGAFAGAAINSFGNALIDGQSFSEALKSGALSGSIAGLGAAISAGVSAFNNGLVSPEEQMQNLNLLSVEQALHAEESVAMGSDVLGGLMESQQFASDHLGYFDYFKNFAVSQSRRLLFNPSTYINIIKGSQEEQYFHKLAELENDYTEFNNALKAVQDCLDTLTSQMNSYVTAQYVCRMQLAAGRLFTIFPEVTGGMGEEEFVQFATSVDMPTSVTMSVGTFVENKLTMDGYAPDRLYYNQQEVSWAIGED